MKPKEIIDKGYQSLMVIYTKCNPAKNESLDGGENYRQLWGRLISETELQLKIFSVIRDGCLSDRCKCEIGSEGLKTIKISPDTELSFMNCECIVHE